MQNQIPKNLPSRSPEQSRRTKEGWQKVRLGEVANDIRVLYVPKKDEHLKYVGLEHIEQGTLRLSDIGDSAATQSAKKTFQENDILFGTLRAYFRKVVKLKFSGVCSTDIAVLRAKSGFDHNFLFYFIANPYFIKFASNPGDGTRMPRAKWNHLAQTEWLLPDYREQKRIGDALSLLDDKIEVNSNIAKTLEEMGQALFKEWFVHFRFSGYEKAEFMDSELGKIPEKWRVGKVNDLIKIISGYPFSSSLYTTDKKALGVVTIRNVQDGDFITECDSSIKREAVPKSMSSECHLQNGDVLLSLTGNVGRVCFVYGGKYLLNQRVAKLIPRRNENLAYTYFLFRQNLMQNYLINLAKGSAQPNLSPVETSDTPIIVPTKEVLDIFNSISGPIYQKLVDNKNENQKLAGLRDLLLPKLMKGDILVNSEE
ncbi:restriction endonuclease subunit S [Candidatus Microgenomates bacterium]|nr:restriction endonuclease subunit S [Candidatus Microgenomates bacterium]